jgi:sensor histidine kinase regulating citrate/malate metabolism
VVDALSVTSFLILNWRLLFTQGISYLVLAYLIYLARRPITRILSQTRKGWWLLCSVPLLMISSFILISAVPIAIIQNPARIPAALLFCGTSIVIYITFFYMLWQQHKQSQLEQNVMALRLSVSDLEHQNELIQQNEKKFTLFRHDVRHITEMLSSCLAQNDIDGAKQWLKPLTQNISVPLQYISRNFTGYGMPDAVLSRYVEQSKEAGIDISVRLDIGKAVIDMTELAVVLANALENAVQACKRIPPEQNKPRIIRVDGQRRGRQFFLEIANTYTGEVMIDEDTGLPTGPTVNDGQEHGFGSQSIAFFAEKHGAVLQYQIEDGWFRLRLLV